MSCDMSGLYLTPRATAALVCLRGGPRKGWSILGALCDRNLRETNRLMSDLSDLGLVVSAPSMRGRGRSWQLTAAGVSHLVDQGLTVTTNPR